MLDGSTSATRSFFARHKRQAVGTYLIGAFLAFPVTAGAQQPADFVFRHGAVYTVSSEKPWAEAVAVANGEIVYVGTDKGVQAYIGSKTEVVELGHGMLLPGFIDAHAHTSGFTSGLDASLTLRGPTGVPMPPKDVLAVVQKYVTEHPDERMVRGRNFIVEAFLPGGPDKKMLDPIVPDRPAVMRSVDGHFMWVNSKTLELAGITADTPDPAPGTSWFQRYPNSREPTGYVIEGKAMAVILSALEKKGYFFESHDRLAKGMAYGLPKLAAAGITAVFDAGSPEKKDFFPVLHDMEAKHALPVRVFASHLVREDDLPGRDLVQEFLDLRQEYHSDLFGVKMMKVLLDGSDNNHTAYMLDPYADDPSTRGAPLWTVEHLDALALHADAEGVDLHIHVVGDAAIRMALDAFAYAADKNGSRDRRNTLTHVNFINPDDIVRMRKQNVIWNSTLAWNYMSPRNITIEHAMGEPRFAKEVHRVQAAWDQGVVMNYSSDAESVQMGSIYKPLDQMEYGRTRQALGKPDFQIMPEIGQRLTIDELIRGYTINGAYMLRMEDKIGSIKVGKRADLVVLGQNLFDVSPYAIHSVPIRMTMMDGKVTYRGEDAAQSH